MRKIITLYIYNMYDVHYKQNAYNSVCSEHDIKLFNQSGLLKLISLCVCVGRLAISYNVIYLKQQTKTMKENCENYWCTIWKKRLKFHAN